MMTDKDANLAVPLANRRVVLVHRIARHELTIVVALLVTGS
jgi:hypothetical protein